MDETVPEVMGLQEAVMYLRTRIGDLAPSESYLSDQSKPSKDRSEARFPRGVRVRGIKKLAWSREALDAYADEVIAQVKARQQLQEAA